MRFIFKLSLAFLLAAPSQALEIRNYTPERHDRFLLNDDGDPVIDANGNVTLNSTAYYDSSLYTAVGYSGDGQFALVTERHVLFAEHFAPPKGFPIFFRNNAGELISRTVESLITVPNGLQNEDGSDQIADVIILRLNAPIFEETGVTPLPYANLGGETQYTSQELVMFGNRLRAGRGLIGPFQNSSVDDPPIDSTRTYWSFYTSTGLNPDDSFVEGGDSGSPSFVTVNGRPALVAVHLGEARLTTGERLTVDSFVPEYVDAINTALATDGYALIPANLDPVILSSDLATPPPLRQAEAATLEITLNNDSVPGNPNNPNTPETTTTNPRLNLLFPTDAIPDSITVPEGWFIDNPSPGDYRVRSATLEGNTSATATITYSSIPTVQEISIQATRLSDGFDSATETYTLPVTETFGGFVAGLTLTGELDDPDQDGIPSLLEYAFGGNPGSNSNLAEGGYPLAPQSAESTGILTFTYARRTDAAARGLTYSTEFSTTLDTDSFSPSLPSGASNSTAPFDPAVPDFEQVTVSIPTGSPDKNFVRVRVTLDE